MLMLCSYLEERAAKLHREALGRIEVSMAGAPPTSFYGIMDHFFRYRDDKESETGEVVYSRDEPTATTHTAAFSLPAHLMKVRGKTSTVISGASAGSELETPKEVSCQPSCIQSLGFQAWSQ